jgi:hypothetical protein
VPGWGGSYFLLGEDSEAVLEGSVLVLEFDELLFVAFEDVDLVLEVADDDLFLVGFDLEGGVEVCGPF